MNLSYCFACRISDGIVDDIVQTMVVEIEDMMNDLAKKYVNNM